MTHVLKNVQLDVKNQLTFMKSFQLNCIPFVDDLRQHNLNNIKYKVGGLLTRSILKGKMYYIIIVE